MRIYYVGESHSRALSVATALGVDGEAWKAVSGRVLDWRRNVEDEYHVPTGRTLRGEVLLSPTGTPPPRGRRDPRTSLEEGLEIMMQGLRVLEHSQHQRGGVGVINVCLGNTHYCRSRALNRARNRAAARGRLLERVSASLAVDGRYACFIEDEAQRDGLPALGAGPVRRDPVLAASRYVGNSGAAVSAPRHRMAGDDELLQLAGLVSYALLQQEEPTAMAEALNFHLAFGILKNVLDRRACPDDPRGVARL